MPFSINQEQVPSPQAGQALTAAAATPTVPDSPFLFMRQRGQEVTPMAYVQIFLVVVALVSVVVCGSMFMYSQYLISSIESKKTELANADLTFTEYPYADMKRLSNRFDVLKKLMKEYISVRSPLKMLEDVVENQVVFNDFKFAKNKDSGYVASFAVVTTNYRAVIQQLEALNLAQYSKIAPQPKFDGFSGSASTIKINVITPVFAQGKHPDDIDFTQFAQVQPQTAGAATGTPSVPQQ